jgi:hypothetical protein
MRRVSQKQTFIDAVTIPNALANSSVRPHHAARPGRTSTTNTSALAATRSQATPAGGKIVEITTLAYALPYIEQPLSNMTNGAVRRPCRSTSIFGPSGFTLMSDL